MERRREIRVETNQPVVVTGLGLGPQSPTGGMIQDQSGGGMLIKLPCAIACGTPVRVETSNFLVLGEVVRCEPAGEQFRVGVTIRHSLRNLQDLENLNRALLGEQREQAEAEELEPESLPVRKPLL